ncbi:MAG: ion transporter [Planctomycetales bacterium]|nr:ion transporter [Planctomycetales bacterium]
MLSWVLQIFIQLLIVYSVVTTALETMPEYDDYDAFFETSETIVVVIFSAEYLIRWRMAKSWWRYPLQGMAIIDLLAILPFFISRYFASSLPSFVPLRALRLLRIFRLLKLARYSRSLQMLGESIRRSGPELIVFMFIATIIVVISAMGLYYAEHEAQPEVYSSIPDSIWWAIVTLTTVGYGDVYPTTAAGRVIASIVMITGIGFIAVPTSLISSTMTELALENRLARQAERKAAEAGAATGEKNSEGDLME